MLTPDQISELHRLYGVEKWPQRKIARHLHIGRRTAAKYLDAPAAKPVHRERTRKIDPWKAAIADHLFPFVATLTRSTEVWPALSRIRSVLVFAPGRDFRRRAL